MDIHEEKEEEKFLVPFVFLEPKTETKSNNKKYYANLVAGNSYESILYKPKLDLENGIAPEVAYLYCKNCNIHYIIKLKGLVNGENKIRLDCCGSHIYVVAFNYEHIVDGIFANSGKEFTIIETRIVDILRCGDSNG